MTLSDLAGLGTGICLGASSLYLRIAMKSEPVPKVIWFVAAFGTVTLAPWAIPALGALAGDGPRAFTGFLFFLAAGLTGQVIGRVFLYACIAAIGPSLGTAYKNAVPLLTALFAWIVFDERITAGTALGIAAVAAGLFQIALFQPRPAPQPENAAATATASAGLPGAAAGAAAPASASARPAGRRPALPPGLALGIGAVVFYSASDLLRKSGMDFLPSATAGTWIGNLLTFALFSCRFAVTGRPGELYTWERSTRRALVIASACVTAGYVLFLVGVASAGVAVTSALAAVEPLAALAVGKLFGRAHEPIRTRQIPGVICVAAGVALIVAS